LDGRKRKVADSQVIEEASEGSNEYQTPLALDFDFKRLDNILAKPVAPIKAAQD